MVFRRAKPARVEAALAGFAAWPHGRVRVGITSDPKWSAVAHVAR